MRFFSRIGTVAAAATVLTGMTALQMTLVGIGNITDFATNQEFVRHVLAMDTTFQSPNMMWRAITSPGLADAAYIAIIAWELLTALALVAGFAAWMRAHLAGRPPTTAKQLSNVGWVMQLTLFGVGFIAIGGEWFQMWQSSKWNGLQPAVHNLIIASFGLVVTHLAAKGSLRAADVPDDSSS
ncbi:DUF2165 domain-containing protein [Amycolatopsis dendrobii]|uniref:DUF2165 domain-containing protein n=1 Tax=Amycolatopsis dendrobii TaxID=2760662 RepID=A0A7W3W3I7_9PSEU|nr:DUF2165 domain-containing protein [Amycolatopsis dendrobii]MBB1158184.1 DUF2165 domain-containing protein [Amycolatopsis dendrobii]